MTQNLYYKIVSSVLDLLYNSYIEMFNSNLIIFCRLAELLLTPTRRINELVNLLTWFRSYTPDGHSDRNDLMLAIKQLYKMDALWEEVRTLFDQIQATINDSYN